MKKVIKFFIIVVLLITIAAIALFYILKQQKRMLPYNYQNPNLPAYLIKDYAKPEYEIGGLLNLDNDYVYSSKDGQIACRDVNKKIEKIEYFSFGAGSGVMGGWGSASAYICGDYYVVKNCNDAWGCIAYGVFKKNEGYQPNVVQKFVKDQLSQQVSPMTTADAFYSYKKSFSANNGYTTNFPNGLDFMVNMKLFLSSKTWNCLDEKYNNNLKKSLDQISYVSAEECDLEYVEFGRQRPVFNIKSQTAMAAVVAIISEQKIEESDYILIFENGYWKVDSTLNCSVLSNPCNIKNIK